MDDRPGGIEGGLISEVRNVHSERMYVVSTAQEIGEEYWSTAVLPAEEKQVLFDLIQNVVPDPQNPVVSFIRNDQDQAHAVHATVKKVVADVPEDDWLEEFPSPKPPDGWPESAETKL